MKKVILLLTAGLLLIGANLFAADGDLIVNGNAGIGTTDPITKLDVRGHAYISEGIYIGDRGDGVCSEILFGGQPGGETHLYTYNDGRFSIFKNPGVGEALTVLHNGNVGIGTTDPGGYKLYINGTAYSTGGWQGSDARFKENISPIESSLETIMKLRGITYNWNTARYNNMGFPTGKHYGVVAQEVEKVMPEAVKEGPNGDKAVAYSEIIPVLIEAVKEQQAMIERLKAEIAGMKKSK